jgi:transglutaminase-like putative cysteine protease
MNAPQTSPGAVHRLVAALTGSRRARTPENSVPFRVAVLGAVMAAAAALTVTGVIEGSVPFVVFLVLPTAAWLSWERRTKNNPWLSIFFTAIAAFALVDVLSELRAISNPEEEIRYPLAKLFLLVQIIHSYDLTTRRDLYFSLGSSLVLMAVAGSLSQDLGFGITLFVYAAFAITALVLGHRSELADGAVATVTSQRTGSSRIIREVLRATLVAAAAGAVLFGFLPQPNGVRPYALPFMGGSESGTPSIGGISNPGFSSFAGTRSSGSSYYALSDRMDLRVRGDLSDEVVMRVRASAPAMWRGMLFDTYDGVAWTSSTSGATPLPGGRPYLNALAGVEPGPRTTLSQTFYLSSEQPNTYFAAATPFQIWADSVPSIDEHGALRATTTLTPGTVYSVVSTKGSAPPSALKRASNSLVPPEMERYLQLPPGLPERVHELARRITARADNDYERVRAIEAYLREHYRYSLDSPVPPPGRDAVDHFLFDARVGFCEQFASSTAVMLRTLGIPARVAVGYTPGTKNPLTGYYEVKGDNAHAWVEVYFPGYGWYEFDPTFNVPLAQESAGDDLAAVRVWRYLSGHFDDLVPEVPIAAAVFTIPFGALFLRRRRYGRRARTAGRTGVGPVALAWGRLEADLARRRTPRRPHETAAETMARLPGGSSDPARLFVRVFEQERYGRDEVAAADIRNARDAIDDVRRRLDDSRRQ